MLREYIEYEAEPKERQTGKTIARFFVDKKGDCKHFATTCVGVLNACGIPAWFVVVRQSDIDRDKFHAYCQAMVNNQIVTMDPCRKVFNTECKFKKKYSIKPLK
jgi:transglutaminase-like putative cysteine protease